ncbi:MAG TPA: arylsulfatase, partial [Microbulbifer sp.]
MVRTYLKRMLRVPIAVTSVALMCLGHSAAQAQDKPNILVIWGDDIGFWNVSFNNRGMLGYKTPNIDRIAN